VEAHIWEPCIFEQCVKRLKQSTFSNVPSAIVAEDRIMLLPSITSFRSCVFLTSAVLFEDVYHKVRENDCVSARCRFRLRLNASLSLQPGRCTTNVQAPLLNVNVQLLEARQFTTSQADRECDSVLDRCAPHALKR
jgi:hypothetical protein